MVTNPYANIVSGLHCCLQQKIRIDAVFLKKKCGMFTRLKRRFQSRQFINRKFYVARWSINALKQDDGTLPSKIHVDSRSGLQLLYKLGIQTRTLGGEQAQIHRCLRISRSQHAGSSRRSLSTRLRPIQYQHVRSALAQLQGQR